jgi:uncharacterized Ntn-hydrolase superfamily protein
MKGHKLFKWDIHMQGNEFIIHGNELFIHENEVSEMIYSYTWGL